MDVFNISIIETATAGPRFNLSQVLTELHSALGSGLEAATINKLKNGKISKYFFASV